MVEAKAENIGAGLSNRVAKDVRLYLRQRPVILTLLALLAILFFVGVSGLSRAYQAQRESLGSRWFNRGLGDLSAGRYDAAVMEFRSALLYSRDNYDYERHLAEALIGLKRTGEASTYLLNLWDRQPEDGVVNLDLARIAAQKGQIQQAIRYYHNAIYAAWPSDQEAKRRDARLELIELLLATGAKAQAQPELIALQENVGEDPAQQERIGDLFLRVGDYEHALAAYRISLKAEGEDRAALAGAGFAAFQLGRYPLAQRYLQAAVAANPSDKHSADLLKSTELVLHMDPFRRQLSVAQRDRIVVEAFSTAGERLKSCGLMRGSALPTAAQTSLADSWAKMKPEISELNLKRKPDLVEQAMNLVFEIERQTSAMCGTPAGTDLALLLIARLHEGS
ncbi:MAG TPA: tetratricopeptide repeat protein [Candidatus Sulfotelmatobacter sp.]|jgi:tetratricopeptide (TPR) repeat protein